MLQSTELALWLVYGNLVNQSQDQSNSTSGRNTARNQPESDRDILVFCAYSHLDQPYRDQLVAHLSGLERERVIKIWYDRKISPGIDWNSEIAIQLDTSDIVLLLLSADFIKSEYCVGVEMRRALERAERGEIRAVPVFLRPFHWPGSAITKLQGLPPNGKPVKKWADRDEAYTEIARGVELVASELRKSYRAKQVGIGTAAASGGRPFSVKFAATDILGWVSSVSLFWRRLNKYPWQIADATATTLPDRSRVAVFGSWATGLYGAPVVARAISNSPQGYQLVLHLGDTYYSGSRDEIRERLLAPWPRVSGAISRALCGNHEMYSGGTPYIEAVNAEFGQDASYFAFQNSSWVLACLDTAYDDHDFHGDQVTWLESLLARAGGRRLILFSHHQPFSTFEPQGPKLIAKLAALLQTQRIFAWYWAHEHHCALYEPHQTWGLLGRCIGHGGMPYFRLALPGSAREKTQFINVPPRGLVPAAYVLDGPNPYITGAEFDYAPNGYLTLELDGPRLNETVQSAEGNVLREQVLA